MLILNLIFSADFISNVEDHQISTNKNCVQREFSNLPNATSNQPYVGENIIKSIGDKWKIRFRKSISTSGESANGIRISDALLRRRKLHKKNLTGVVNLKKNISVGLSQDSLSSVQKDAEYWQKLINCFKSAKINSNITAAIINNSVRHTNAENHHKSSKNAVLSGNA